MCEKVCWTCGNYAFGCFVTGEYNTKIKVDDTCDKWCPEGTEGTITDDELNLQLNNKLKDQTL